MIWTRGYSGFPSDFDISFRMSSFQFRWPAMPNKDLAVSTRTPVLESPNGSSHTPTVSPPEPTASPTLRGLEPSTYKGSVFWISNPATISESRAAFCTTADGFPKTVDAPEGIFGVEAHPAVSKIANIAAGTKHLHR